MTKPLGPYSPVVRAGEWVVTSGQIKPDAGDIPAQTTAAISQVRELLESQGASLADVVKTTVFLVDMGDFDAMNEAYVAAFGDHRPARSTIGVAALPAGARVEVEAWAHLGR
ncbi:MAG TPA: RidA family protein [Acidimicrobiales bacterium]|nr:RidA family protein [Acidimicrobiales bacterium]